ncbi:MAG TPA: hypothetical protein VFF63_05605 [Candidatus Babeliales bacterium]|nr:hypothetical protein [Candidatus Babeliales bacterium]
MTLCILAVIVGVPIGARPASGSAALQYYVGSWSCTGGPIGQTPVKAAVTYTLDDGVMREWVTISPQGKMKKPYVLSIATTYDAKNGRYVQDGVDSDAAWFVSFAKPWSGNTEQWADHTTSSGKLGHGQTVRSQNSFVYTGYPSLTATKPDFHVACQRSS